jgi:glycosyltransferase involved in cell wall biosynthesis
MRDGLEALGELAGFVPTDDIGHELDDALTDGFDAPIGVHVGPPTIASVMQGHGHHKHRLAMIAVNSSYAPRNAIVALEREAVTGFLAPSPWARDVLAKYATLPVYCWLHGVSDAYVPAAKRSKPTGYSVLHMASTHNERKGTAKLIEAWARCVGRPLPNDSVLTLICDGPRGFFDEAIRKATNDRPELQGAYHVRVRMDLSDEEACRFYQWHDLVCQPSRAEGFGLVPLEARASGVPVIMTNGTGHSCHSLYGAPGGGAPPGVIVVQNNGSHPIDDGPDARAPRFGTDQLVSALRLAYENREHLAAGALELAPRIRRAWSWEEVCRLFLEEHGRELQ